MGGRTRNGRMRRVMIIESILTVSIVALSAVEEYSLSSNWSITNDARKISLTNCSLPTDIFLELYKQGQISDPYYRDNDVNYRWISREAWTFTKVFNFSTTSKNSILLASGVDTVSSIFLNDKLVGNTSNMFREYRLAISNLLALNGLNTLRIEFESPVLFAEKQFNAHIAQKGYFVPPACPPFVQHGECHVNHIRKSQASFSWVRSSIPLLPKKHFLILAGLGPRLSNGRIRRSL